MLNKRNMNKFLCCLGFVFIAITTVQGQKSIDQVLKRWNKQSVPYVHVDELSKIGNSVLLDTRAKEEFNVSHLKNALWVGYKSFSTDSVRKKVPDNNTAIIVYCSIGVRSENIGEKLKAMGYTNVKNLYGGIFEWKNNDHAVYGPEGKETQKIHAFNRHWAKLLIKGEKVY